MKIAHLLAVRRALIASLSQTMRSLGVPVDLSTKTSPPPSLGLPQTIDQRPHRPTVIDIFSGAGGLSLGFEMAGFDVVSAVEYDPVHAATHLYNFPLTEVICRDVSEVSAAALLQSAKLGWNRHNPGLDPASWDGIVDVIVGGPSCQGFSIMGKQDVNDSRNQLVLQFVRLIEEIRPRAFCMENVPGFLHSQFSTIREEALKRFRAAGYSISGDTTVHKAVDFGVPQKRRRVLITGTLHGTVGAPMAERGRYTVGDALAGLPNPGMYRSTQTSDRVALSADDTDALSAENDYAKLATLRGNGAEYFGHARKVDESILTGFRATVHRQESVQRFEATPQGTVERISRAFRLSESDAANTLRAGTGRERGAFSASRPIHPTEARVILVREAARLHSFPDWFRFHTTNWHGHRQIGNAVPPLLAKAVASATMRALGHSPSKSTLEVIELGNESLLSLTPTEAARALDADDEQIPKRARQVRAPASSETPTEVMQVG